jgi:hypothetical protein
MADIIFVNGIKANLKEFDNGGWIIKLGCKVDTLIEFLEQHKNDKGYVNIDITTSRDGKPYAKLNTYKKEATDEGNIVKFGEVEMTEDVPF